MDANIYRNILKYTQSGADYKQFCLVCWEWYGIMNELFPKGGKFVNHLLTIFKLFRGKFADHIWQVISNPNISLNDIQSEFRLDVNTRLNLTFRFANPNVTLEYLKTQDHISFYALSKNPNVTWDYIKVNMHEDWNLESLYDNNPNLTFENYEELDASRDEVDTHLGYFTSSPNITLDLIRSRPDIDWDYTSLTMNSKFTFTDIKNNDDIDWVLYYVVRNPNITMKTIESNPTFPWVLHEISKNPNITWQDVMNHPEIKWNYSDLASNHNITWNIIRENRDKFKNIGKFSLNPNMTWEIFLNYPESRIYEKLAVNKFKYYNPKKFSPWLAGNI